ncbi:MAG: type II secretion system minor pseudopilin GspK [Immundisolibacter sp.]|uniref:type II secretion system minor pseudopilin GspK n=1 Tax=Immundisolibacter sp. TaxID=1934948 RepID=UPI0019A437A8|nr:type II secretion system minor pseudopilin GspK [Immundisolibacter sp.]MBC7162047.1 type II secretion system minor pseudopilin GspK [Immundisolibacter sp.]
MMRSPQRQRGVALILALLLMTIATVVAVAVASNEEFAIRRSSNVLRRAQASEYLTAGEYLAMARLRPAPSDAAAPSPVRIELPWPLDLPGQAQVQDAQGCFNLNVLSLPPGETDLAEQRLRRLLELLDLPPDIADQLLDWLDEDTNARFAGAEDDVYSRRRPPMRTPNAPLGDVSELRLLPAMDAEAYAALAPLVCALPAQAGINVNSAPPLLLMALAEGLRPGQARDLAARAAATPFASLDAFLADPALSGVLLDGGGLTVRSDWFTVRAQVTLDQLLLQRDSLLQVQDGRVRVRRRREQVAG